jgi:hypothetical protein
VDFHGPDQDLFLFDLCPHIVELGLQFAQGALRFGAGDAFRVKLRFDRLHAGEQAVIVFLKAAGDVIRPPSVVLELYVAGGRRSFDPRDVVTPRGG